MICRWPVVGYDIMITLVFANGKQFLLIFLLFTLPDAAGRLADIDQSLDLF